ncbi:MAG: tRNA (adenosine(37)-N6)-threonylcarbamoyltransferase complex transferase subunit TsaD [Verrucomicrobia bacterium Tous-C9LFEB]|nr:MAG: tRNA (adenosine(37)-N6)-threonylcarbamoyltransferase complex transferase subunit TsaD [Verrucomicrobia bacterium Tous-C9LFEB]
MRVLGIETSCDETAVSVVEAQIGKTGILANVVSSQIRLHEQFGGIVPEVATREHLRNLPQLVPGLLTQSRIRLDDLDAIAVTQGPGLATSLLIGYSYARALGLAADIPVCGVNHLEGHLFSPFLALSQKVEFPFIGLIVSGGHTLLVHAKGWNHYEKLGGTVDDAAGEAFDKVARLMDISYPGGPKIERLARTGNAEAYAFPRSFPQKDNFNFSFSGLKTSVRYFFEKNPQAHDDNAWKADLCASFQSAVVDVLARKAGNALAATGCKRLVASGGVLCNNALRVALAQACAEQGANLLVADPKLCTDNAAMIAATAAEKMAAGIPLTLATDIDPNLSLFKRPGSTAAVKNKEKLMRSLKPA